MSEALTEPSDEQLVAEHAQGVPGRFEMLVERYNQELYHFLVRFTGGTATAEDVVQEAFLQVHLSASTFDTSRRFKPWLFTIAANKARDLLRGKARRSEVSLDASVDEESGQGQRFSDFLAGTDLEPDRPMEKAEQEQIVRRTVEQMPEHLKETLILAYYHRFPYKDMAEILGVPLGTVKSRLHAAVAAFSEAYRKQVGSEGEPE
ncbi:MAG: sigma-70 family RNA polymerase sigma factor [Phycisphaerae bacterium]|nr:sigma-70 family RNA polymerase sigma factor [Phycisphaerae bacterium]